MHSSWAMFEKLSKRRFVRYGLPFMIMMVGGSFGLKEFAQLRYTFSKQQKVTKKDLEELGVQLKKEDVTLESTYEQIKEIDIDNWHNIRGPRPWEDPNPEFESMRTRNKIASK